MVSSSLRYTCILGNASTAVANFILVWYFRDRFRPRDSPDQKPCHYLSNVAKALSLVARISVDWECAAIWSWGEKGSRRDL